MLSIASSRLTTSSVYRMTFNPSKYSLFMRYASLKIRLTLFRFAAHPIFLEAIKPAFRSRDAKLMNTIFPCFRRDPLANTRCISVFNRNLSVRGSVCFFVWPRFTAARLYNEPFPSFLSSSFEDIFPTLRFHTFSKSVRLLSFSATRLIGTFHFGIITIIWHKSIISLHMTHDTHPALSRFCGFFAQEC